MLFVCCHLQKKLERLTEKLQEQAKRFRFSSLKLLSVKENNIQYVNHF